MIWRLFGIEICVIKNLAGIVYFREIVCLLSNWVTWQNCYRAESCLAPDISSYRGDGSSHCSDCVKQCAMGLPRGNEARGIHS